jgi:Spy/CpxP family protein refolding chaperone
MWWLEQSFDSRRVLLAAFVAASALLAWAPPVTAQDNQPPDHAKHQHAGKAPDADRMAGQIRDLQAKIAELEAALKQGHQGTAAGAPPAPGMGSMSMTMGGKQPGKGMMGEMGMAMPGMGGMGAAEMDMDAMEMMGMIGMGGMGQKGMKGMSQMQRMAALPGFPGASHIYHIGATGFFLDHPEHVRLTAEQQTALNHVKEKALLNKATAERKIEEAEQELWAMTGSDQPDAAKIEAKAREIERLRGDQRLAFIRSVGEAAKFLTDGQRQALLGAAADHADKPAAHAGH